MRLFDVGEVYVNSLDEGEGHEGAPRNLRADVK